MFKHLHMTLAVISIFLFTLRFIWTLMESKQLSRKWVKITPHVIDTLLFALGVAMAVKLAINPIEQLWLGEKILAVIAYIFTGYFTLKLARNRTMQIIGYLGAMGWILLVVRIAMTKENVLF
ncbi:SirB2 family protein [Thalassotalea piscium]|uniref:Putative membrane protein SirB2 n=1 Tax=Thalassotalea piscium TaxID=1230533 RepID=A0A7X0NIR2_9GAMM|nr:SirB2 family protein [Thalassotalea piscium]MBB6544133.1 putative membrane protein SirB2 [Thalassotalea piscium]